MRPRLMTVARSSLRPVLATVAAAAGGLVPVPVAVVLDRLAFGREVLTPRPGEGVSSGSVLSDKQLAGVLADHELGTWALGHEVIDLLAELVLRRRPRYVLEMGSGSSTLVWAVLMERIWGSEEPRVFSLEQDEDHVTRSLGFVADAGLERLVRIRHAPLGPVAVGHLRGACYQTDEMLLDELLGDVRPELLVIDGPAGPAGVRALTFPLVADRLAPGCLVALDDALRPGEISVASMWRDDRRLQVLGIHLVGRGVLLARVTG